MRYTRARLGLVAFIALSIAIAMPSLSAVQQPPVPKVTPIPAPPDVAAPPPDAQKTASGLASKVLAPGTGKEHPTKTDEVTIHYTGWKPDGTMFDSSVARGKEATYVLTRLIPGWIEGVPLMVAGEKRRFWIPEKLAYGPKGRIPGMLVFDIELISFSTPPPPPPPPAPPQTPPDVAAPPQDSLKTPSGLATKVLQPGKGTRHPTRASMVTVHYSGWTTAGGKPFDSSVAKGEPLTMALGDFIPGFTEGVMLMVEGEKRRLWIPQDLAYKGQPGAPAGMLVFDVELIAIK